MTTHDELTLRVYEASKNVCDCRRSLQHAEVDVRMAARHMLDNRAAFNRATTQLEKAIDAWRDAAREPWGLCPQCGDDAPGCPECDPSQNPEPPSDATGVDCWERWESPRE